MRAGPSGINFQSDGLHGMSPRSVGRLVDMQHPRSTSPLRSASAATPGLRDKAAGPGVRFSADTWTVPATAQSAGSLQALTDRARMQPAANWLPKLPLATAAAGASFIPGARNVPPGPGERSMGSSSASPRNTCFKVPYHFSTPTEKRLQKQLEVRLARRC
jgi:hypothetical protein